MPHPPMSLLYVEDLARMVCSTPDCTEDHSGQPLFIRSRCHPKDGTLAANEPLARPIEPGSDHLHLVCQTGARGMATLAMATQQNPRRRT